MSPVRDEQDALVATKSGSFEGAAGFIFIFSVGLFMTCLVAAAILAVKPVEVSLFGYGLLVPIGTFAFALTFSATDVVSEVWGRKMAAYVVINGVLMRGVLFLLFAMGVGIEDWTPIVSNPPFWSETQEAAFDFMLAGSIRTNLAGIVAFALSAATDVAIYHYFRERDRGKNRLWWRNNISTIVAQIVNSLIFVTVAFGGSVPWLALFSLIAGQIVFKMLTAFLDTPLVYVLRNLATGRKLFDFSG